MAQSVPPGDITTQPGTKIVFNASYDDKHTYHIKVSLFELLLIFQLFRSLMLEVAVLVGLSRPPT